MARWSLLLATLVGCTRPPPAPPPTSRPPAEAETTAASPPPSPYRTLVTQLSDEALEVRRAAIGDLDARCRAGAPQACHMIETTLRTGGAPRDEPLPPRAAIFEEECNAGRMDSCVLLGLLLDDDGGMPRDGERAFELFERACEGGHPFGCYRAGIFYRVSVPSQREDAPERAADRYQRACRAGYPSACSGLAQLLREREPDLERAAELVRRGCALGDPQACLSIAEAALPERPFACDQCAELGDGYGGCMDCRLWAEYREHCCPDCPERDRHAACADIELVPQHPERSEPLDPAAVARAERVAREVLDPAIRWLGSSCDAGYPEACLDLATLVGDERFPTHEPATAKAALARSCEHGEGGGCVRLARMIEDREPDRAHELRERAHSLFDAACRAGDGGACWGRATVARELAD